MSDGEAEIEVRLTRYDVTRLRLAQVLIPFVSVATILARRVSGSLWISVAIASQVLTVFVLLGAIRRFGWQPLVLENGALRFGATGIEASRQGVRDWTYLGGVARIYRGESSLRLRARPGAELALEAVLRALLGQPRTLVRRGSKRARIWALVAGTLGLVLVALAFALDATLLVPFGVATFIFGVATFGALSQRVAEK